MLRCNARFDNRQSNSTGRQRKQQAGRSRRARLSRVTCSDGPRPLDGWAPLDLLFHCPRSIYRYCPACRRWSRPGRTPQQRSSLRPRARQAPQLSLSERAFSTSVLRKEINHFAALFRSLPFAQTAATIWQDLPRLPHSASAASFALPISSRAIIAQPDPE